MLQFSLRLDHFLWRGKKRRLSANKTLLKIFVTMLSDSSHHHSTLFANNLLPNLLKNLKIRLGCISKIMLKWLCRILNSLFKFIFTVYLLLTKMLKSLEKIFVLLPLCRLRIRYFWIDRSIKISIKIQFWPFKDFYQRCRVHSVKCDLLRGQFYWVTALSEISSVL